MPIYEYRCDDCTDTFEILTSFEERDRPHACPSCESRDTHVLISGFATSGGGEEGVLAGGGCACGGRCSCSSPN